MTLRSFSFRLGRHRRHRRRQPISIFVVIFISFIIVVVITVIACPRLLKSSSLTSLNSQFSVSLSLSLFSLLNRACSLARWLVDVRWLGWPCLNSFLLSFFLLFSNAMLVFFYPFFSFFKVTDTHEQRVSKQEKER